MSSVARCKMFARRLVDSEARTTGAPIKDCIRAVARRLREPHGTILALVYRDPADVRLRLAEALVVEVSRQIRAEIAGLENELLACNLGLLSLTDGEIAEIEKDAASLRKHVAKLRGQADV